MKLTTIALIAATLTATPALAAEYTYKQKVCVITTMSRFIIVNQIQEAEATGDEMAIVSAIEYAPFSAGKLMYGMLAEDFSWDWLTNLKDGIESGRIETNENNSNRGLTVQDVTNMIKTCNI